MILFAALPVDVGGFRSAEGCGECHLSEYRDWDQSRHRASWTNDLLFQGYLDETQPFCVTCHAPLSEQTAEVLANGAFYRSRSGGPPAASLPEPLAAEGVTCAACHLREGRIVSSEAPLVHRDAIVAPELGSGEVCRTCHEFAFPVFGPGGTVVTDELMQSTWTEWTRWTAGGGDQSCVDCHLPDGRHLFRGAHDVEFLRGSIAVEAGPEHLTVRSVGVGHALPTGDLYRHLTLEVDRGEGFVVVDRIGRTFRTWLDPALDRVRKGLAEDRSLQPGEARVIGVDGPARWRLVYHYASEADEQRGRLPLDQIEQVLAEGVVP